MQLINSPDNQFHDGDPFNGVQGTPVTAAFLNSIQAELANVILGEQIALDPNDNTQLRAALISLIARLSYTDKAKRYYFSQI
jgi:hypothetical protein